VVRLKLCSFIGFVNLNVTISEYKLISYSPVEKFQYGMIYTTQDSTVTYLFTRDGLVKRWNTEMQYSYDVNNIHPKYTQKYKNNTLKNIKNMLESNPKIFEDFENYETISLIANL